MTALSSRDTIVSKTAACRALGVSRAMIYPDRRQRVRKASVALAPSRQLSVAEREQAMTLMHSERFADQAPRVIHATMLDEGQTLASVSTLYRLLRATGASAERRAQRPPQRHVAPCLEARAPHQVWTWDITKLPTLTRGIFLCLYVILDLFSRYVVGWMLSSKENAGLARHLFERTITRHGIAPESLIVHQDRGAPMIAHSFRDLLTQLGVGASYSRPRISDDNPFSESQFKTLKYDADYPGRFRDAEHARSWLSEFFPRYAQRPHEGIAMFSPADVFHGRIDEVWQVRQNVMAQHFDKHPQRYPNGPPIIRKPPTIVTINPLDGIPRSAAELLTQHRAFRIQPPPVEIPYVVI